MNVPAEGSGPPSVRVLLVDADGAHRLVLREMLEAGGYDVVDTDTAGLACRAAASSEFHVVIADNAMPDVRLAIQQSSPDLPVLLMVDDPSILESRSPTQLRAMGYVAKPIRGLLLLAALQDAIKRP